ncbi:hypothetical protein G7Y79_00017g041910 [Physcia stellaris]|nr:hypothetical protein G7Y79_00017g041910 [Physcia stellaris]
MPIIAHPTLSIYNDSTYQDLFEIRESLCSLLKSRKVWFGLIRNTNIREFNKDVRTNIKALRANALYKAGKDDEFGKCLNALHRRTGDTRSITYGVDLRLFEESRLQLRKSFEILEQRIWQAIEANGEEAKLGKLLLKPFLKWENRDHVSHAQVGGTVARTEEVAWLGEAHLKSLLKKKIEEDFWDQFAIERGSETSS